MLGGWGGGGGIHTPDVPDADRTPDLVIAMPYLEGQGDLVSVLIGSICHILTAVFPKIDLITTST